MDRRILVAGLGLVGVVWLLFLVLGGEKPGVDVHPAPEFEAIARAPGVGAPLGRTGVNEVERGTTGPSPRHDRRLRAVADSAAVTGRVAGRVVSSDDPEVGVAGAEITFLRGGASVTVSSGVDGDFQFAPESEGRFAVVMVTADGYWPYAPDLGHGGISVTFQAGMVLEGVELKLAPRVATEGTVVTGEGRPVPGASVQVVDDGWGEDALSAGHVPVESDADGAFTLDARPGAILEAIHDAVGAGRATVGQGATTIVLREGDGERLSVSGFVRSTDDLPVPGASIVGELMLDNAASRSAPAAASVRGNADGLGSFALGGLVPGRYSLSVTAEGHGAVVVEGVLAGAENVSVRLPEAHSLRGRVRDATSGEPIVGYAVTLFSDPGSLRRDVYAGAVTLDPGGRFELADVARGDYSLGVTPIGRPSGRRVSISVPHAGELDVLVHRGVTVEGRVHTTGDEPVPSAKVWLEGHGFEVDISTTSVDFQVQSDNGGRFRLEGPAAGTFSIVVDAEGYHRRVMPVEAQVAGGTVQLNVELAPVPPDGEKKTELVGIGAALGAQDDVLLVGQVLEGGGAHRAGLVEGDAILAVDGIEVQTSTFPELIQRIRGQEGTVVALRVRRADGTVVLLEVVRTLIATK